MPISLAALQQALCTIPVEYDGETVNVTYQPGKLTPAFVAGLESLKLEEQVTQLVAAWEILDEKGKPLPVTLELAQQLPLPFLAAITVAINESIRPNGRRAAT